MAVGSLRVLRHRNYALLWGSGLISDAGTWMQAVAIGALVTELTDQALWGGVVAAMSFFAAAFVSPIGGVIADRHNRRRMLLFISMLQAIVATGLAIVYLMGDVSPVVLVINTAIEGVMVALLLPARSAMLPDLVPKDEVLDAAALGAASWNLGRVIGPGFAGLVLVVGSYDWIFLINAVSFIAVTLAMVFIQLPPHKLAPASGGIWARFRSGAEATRQEPGCRSAVFVLGITGVLVSPFIALVPAMSQIVLDGKAVDTAHLVVAQGVGAVVGALALSPLARRFGRNRAILGALFLAPVCEIAYAFSPNSLSAALLLVLLGGAYISLFAGMSAVVQLRAPAGMRARVISIYITTLNLTYPLGATVQGWLGDRIGIRTVLAAGPAIYLVIMATIYLKRRDILLALDVPAAPADS